MAGIIDSGSAPVDFLALGDSYTIGEGVRDEQRWPVQLAAALRARGVAIAHPQIIAKSGWTTDELSAAIDAEDAHGNLQAHYDLVSLQIGVNNQYRGRSGEDYGAEFSRLFERAVAFAGGDPARVLVLSIPDWGTTPFAQAGGRDRAQIASEIDQYNEVAATLCRRRSATWVDVTGLTRRPDLGHELVADGLHPSAAMYTLWVDRIHDKIRP